MKTDKRSTAAPADAAVAPKRRPKNLPRVYFNTGEHIVEAEHSRESYAKGKIDKQFVAGIEAACSEFFRVAWPEGGPTPRAAKEYFTLRPAAEYHEDHGTVLWWHLPIQEPPYVGAGPGMNECDRYGGPTNCASLLERGWLTHWSPIPQPTIRAQVDGEVSA